MDSISKSAQFAQVGEGVTVYPFGIKVSRSVRVKSPQKGGGGPVGGVRGEIAAFSASSRRRMRETMLRYWIPNSDTLGLTLTVPWKGTNFAPLMDEYRDCWHRFRVAFVRRFPHSALIYRIELQQRGAPHTHAILYLAQEDAQALPPVSRLSRHGGESLAASLVGLELFEMWARAVPNLHRGSYRAFMRHGVLVEPILSAGAMFRYLADHASKHKQAQLGYKGKQWGVIGKSNLVRRESFVLPPFVSPRHEAIFFRLLRKVMRYRLQASRHPNWTHRPPFGSVLKGSRRSVGCFYLRKDTAIRMYEHSRQLALGDCTLIAKCVTKRLQKM